MYISVNAMDTLDDTLLSLEKLDRTSPEMWPEQSMVCEIKLMTGKEKYIF
jgi:hypothetical protein